MGGSLEPLQRLGRLIARLSLLRLTGHIRLIARLRLLRLTGHTRLEPVLGLGRGAGLEGRRLAGQGLEGWRR